MARNKNIVTRSRRRSSTSSRRDTPGNLKRFLKALSASAAAAFTIASCVLNPQWREAAPVDALRETVASIEARLPGTEGAPRTSAPDAVMPTGAQVQTQFRGCPQFFPGGHAPVVPAGAALRELCFDAFAVLHSGTTKTPVFVAQRLNRQMLSRAAHVARTDRFYADARLPAGERAELNDYKGSGLSRGHMAPAADMHTAEAMAQSFSLANMVPQDQRHNGGAWNRIEQDTRKYVMRAAGDVYIYTGPVYAARPPTIGEGKVAVPSHLYKVVHDASSGRSWVHWQENGPDVRAGPPISYEEFVRRTGLRLLPEGRG